jgi:hypothetical protein
MEWVREGVENSAGDRPRCGAFSSILESEWRIELPPGARSCFWGGIFVVTKRSWLRCKNLDKGGFLAQIVGLGIDARNQVMIPYTEL